MDVCEACQRLLERLLRGIDLKGPIIYHETAPKLIESANTCKLCGLVTSLPCNSYSSVSWVSDGVSRDIKELFSKRPELLSSSEPVVCASSVDETGSVSSFEPFLQTTATYPGDIYPTVIGSEVDTWIVTG